MLSVSQLSLLLARVRGPPTTSYIENEMSSDNVVEKQDCEEKEKVELHNNKELKLDLDKTLEPHKHIPESEPHKFNPEPQKQIHELGQYKTEDNEHSNKTSSLQGGYKQEVDSAVTSLCDSAVTMITLDSTLMTSECNGSGNCVKIDDILKEEVSSAEIPFKEKTECNSSTCVVKSDSRLPSSIHNIDSTYSTSRPDTNLTKTDLKQDTTLTKTDLRLVTNLTKTDLRQDTNLTETDLRQDTNLTETDLRPVTNLTKTDSRPDSNLTKTDLKQDTTLTKTDLRQDTNLTKTGSRLVTNLTKTDLRQDTNLTKTDSRPDSNTKASVKGHRDLQNGWTEHRNATTRMNNAKKITEDGGLTKRGIVLNGMKTENVRMPTENEECDEKHAGVKTLNVAMSETDRCMEQLEKALSQTHIERGIGKITNGQVHDELDGLTSTDINCTQLWQHNNAGLTSTDVNCTQLWQHNTTGLASTDVNCTQLWQHNTAGLASTDVNCTQLWQQNTAKQDWNVPPQPSLYLDPAQSYDFGYRDVQDGSLQDKLLQPSIDRQTMKPSVHIGSKSLNGYQNESACFPGYLGMFQSSQIQIDHCQYPPMMSHGIQNASVFNDPIDIDPPEEVSVSSITPTFPPGMPSLVDYLALTGDDLDVDAGSPSPLKYYGQASNPCSNTLLSVSSSQNCGVPYGSYVLQQASMSTAGLVTGVSHVPQQASMSTAGLGAGVSHVPQQASMSTAGLGAGVRHVLQQASMSTAGLVTGVSHVPQQASMSTAGLGAGVSHVPQQASMSTAGLGAGVSHVPQQASMSTAGLGAGVSHVPQQASMCTAGLGVSHTKEQIQMSTQCGASIKDINRHLEGKGVVASVRSATSSQNFDTQHASLQAVHQIFHQKVCVQDRDKYGDNPLHEIPFLDEQDFDKMFQWINQDSGFHLALNTNNNMYQTPLYCCVQYGKHLAARFYVQYGADPNIQCREIVGDTKESIWQGPVHKAVENGDVEMLTILINSPIIDINAERTYDRKTPIMVALQKHVLNRAEQDKSTIIKLLIHSNADLSKMNSAADRTILMSAVERKDVNIVRCILEKVGHTEARNLVNTQNKDGNTCMHIVAGLKNINMVDHIELGRLLLMHGGLQIKNFDKPIGFKPDECNRILFENIRKSFL